ncbi:heat shock 70 kDa protein 12A-like isoform X2 [Mya arenaria]|uniref:heat shock 70 kDa protein 12A-like isoform X2 n=1 Tax=Mya arenaria TaxID=6604 RepID=UPI0022E0B1FD|nr:heat shock 70 kDa protein 12A-like isoform X2 [Mya arenaria]
MTQGRSCIVILCDSSTLYMINVYVQNCGFSFIHLRETCFYGLYLQLHNMENFDVLSRIPDDKELSLVANEIGNGWELLAASLGLSTPFVQRLKIDHNGDSSQQIFHMLIKWKQAKAMDATFRNLFKEMKASLSVDFHEICTKLKFPTGVLDKLEQRRLVASIDFGTTNSSWAYSFDTEFVNNPTKIVTKQWGKAHILNDKEPTSILISGDGLTFEAFGNDAEKRYSNLAGDGKHRNTYFFSNMKMFLFTNKVIDKDMKIKDTFNNELPAQRVISMALKFLKDDLMKDVRSRNSTQIHNNDVLWVLTVPAIWSDQAKCFMRECAVMAGILNENLILALEPEAASMFCRNISVEKTIGSGESSVSSFKPGETYIILDAGGGTVDITVHTVLENGKLKEMHTPSGGNWGGRRVDEAFEELLDATLGCVGIFDHLKQGNMEDYLEFRRRFEILKREISPNQQADSVLSFPYSFIGLVKDTTGKSIEELMDTPQVKSRLTFDQGRLSIKAAIMQDLFSMSINNIVHSLCDIVCNIPPCKAVVMVGGFSKSPMLQSAVRSAFPNIGVILPSETGLAIIKGAVIFGHTEQQNGDIIQSRIARSTYGLNAHSDCDPKQPQNAFTSDSGKKMVKNGFEKLIERGKPTKSDASREFSLTPFISVDNIEVPLFRSAKANPMYINEPGCENIGRIVLPIYLSNNLYKFVVEFGGTEIIVRVVNSETGKEVKRFLDLPC